MNENEEFEAMREEMELLKIALETEKKKTAEAIASATLKRETEEENRDASPKETFTPILVAPYRQMTRFSGYPDRAGGPSIQEWVMDMKGYLAAKRGNEAEKAACVVGHLTGRARQEIVARGNDVLNSADKIFHTLIKSFWRWVHITPTTTTILFLHATDKI